MIKKKLTLPAKKKLTPKSIYSGKPRKDAFEERDVAYLKSKPDIKLGKFRGEGLFGEFREIEGNDRLGVKVPLCYHEDNRLAEVKSCKECGKKHNILREAKNCKKGEYDKEPMLTPTQLVKINRNGKQCIGLVRPLVKVVDDDSPLTDSQLRQIRNKVVELSKKGIILHDGIQCGFTPSGRALQFDLGGVGKGYKVTPTFYFNRGQWLDFLATVKQLDYAAEQIEIAIESVEYDEDPLEDSIRSAHYAKNSTMIREFEELKGYLRKYGDIVR